MTAAKDDEVRKNEQPDDEVTKVEAEVIDSDAENADTKKTSNSENEAQEAKGSEAESVAEATDDAESGNEEQTPEEVLAQVQEEAKEWKDKYYRLHAEWDTYRRRMNEQREEEKLRATEKLVEELIPVLDDFERTVNYAEQNGEKGLLEGVKAVQAKLGSALEKEGVEVINPKGEAFDALEAQAVATVDDDTVPDETVAEVYQKGYRMGNKVIRSAMVTVTTGGPKREIVNDNES